MVEEDDDEDYLDTLSDNEKCLLLNADIIEGNKEILEEAENNLSEASILIERPQCYIQEIPEKVIVQIPLALRNPKSTQLETARDDLTIFIKGYENTALEMNKLIREANSEIKRLLNPNKSIEKELNNISKNLNEKITQYKGVINSNTEGLESIVSGIDEKNKMIFENDKQIEIKKVNDFANKANKLEKNYGLIYKDISTDVKDYGDSLKLFPDSINNLAKEITDSFKEFKEIGEILQEINPDNLDEFNSNLLKLKQGLINIGNKVKEEKNNLSTNVEKIKSINQEKEKEVEDVKSQCENELNEMNILSKELSQEINKIREKYNQNKIDEKVFEVQMPEISEIKKNILTIKNQIASVGQIIIDKYNIVEEQPKEALNRFSLDLLIIMDITGSMGSYLENAKQTVISIVESIKEKNNKVMDIKYGFIGYRDFSDKDYVDIDLTEDYESVSQRINDVNADGGDDVPEDVAGGFTMALKKNWVSKARYAILVADAPCHGRQYHESEMEDNYPEKDPENYNMYEIVKEMIKNKINLFALKITSDTDIFYSKLEQYYKNSKLNFEIHEIEEDASKLAEIISETAAETYRTFRIDKSQKY